MEQKKRKNKSKKGKYVLIGLGVVAITGTAFYFVNQNNKNKQSSLLPDELVEPSHAQTTLPAPSGGGSSSSTSFPLKKGSRGNLVKQIQETLIAKFGKSILPKYGADGHWGTEMQTAMQKLKLPTAISATLFKNILTSGVLQMNGLPNGDLIQSINKAVVWSPSGLEMKITENTILGEFIDAKNGITKFKTSSDEILFIHTKNISYV